MPMDAPVGTVTKNTAVGSGAGDVELRRPLHNRFIERLALPLVVLTDVNP